MSKATPTEDLIRRRLSLQEMAERGTEHEAIVAREKLATLEAKFDFSLSTTELLDDLFALKADLEIGKGKFATILDLKPADEEVGNFVKWAFLHRFGVDSHWDKKKKGRSVLRAEISAHSAKSLRPVALEVVARFNELWSQYSERDTLRLDQRRPFFCGLYDGMMESPREAGERIPMVSGIKKKGRGRKQKTSAEVVVEVHPYETGLVLGGMIRAKVSPEELSDRLRLMLSSE